MSWHPLARWLTALELMRAPRGGVVAARARLIERRCGIWCACRDLFDVSRRAAAVSSSGRRAV